MMVDKGDRTPEVYDHHFWESEPSLTLRKVVKPDGTKFRYFDDKGIFNFVFLLWVYRWVKETSKRYLDPYMIHPLPLADQILKWQPILSKHISDGIASLEAYEYMGKDGRKKAPKPVKYILCRAIFLTFWKRLLTALLGIVIMNAVGMSIAIFLHKLLGLLSDRDFRFMAFLGLALSIILMELFKEICMDHINYYVQRLEIVMDSSVRISLFQHGLCYRRSQFGHLSNNPDSCKSVIHNCSGEDVCADNPLLCPARRYKNNDFTPKIYPLVLNDPYFIPLFVEFMAGMIDFLTAFTYGMILMSSQFNMGAMTILLISFSLVGCMIIMEILNGFLLKYYFGVRDYRITKTFEVISNLPLIQKMSLDDISQNAITEARNDELLFILIRFFSSLVNKILFTVIICVDIILVVNDFMGQVKDATDVKSIRPAELLTAVYILMKIIIPLNILPLKLKLFVYTFNSFLRVERFLRTCSPNFYIPDNRFTGDIPLPEALPDKNKTLPKGLVVMLKKASFAWVNSRKDLLDNTGTTYLRDLDFVLNSGNLAIITGAKGAGKTNFIKAILGDMTLVEGSMAVLPLSTNMPIFYASQDVWLQKGTIRANITFGHRFDEKLYNTVLKAVELEHDISTWEEGDMRKISEHGYSLSGGQRVRVGLARAIYAYLIFSETNRESGSDHSFLVALDDCFTSLDPFVARTIFRNLFNVNGGLLAKDDVSAVLTISKRILEACVSSESPDSFPDAPIYFLENKGLIQENRLKSLIENEVGRLEPPKPSFDRVKLSSVSRDILKRCSSDDFTKLGRRRSTESRYSDSPTVQMLYDRINFKRGKNKNFKPYLVYLRAAGWSIMFFFIFTFTFATLDSTKFVITSKVSDSILDYANKHYKTSTSLEDVKEYCIKALQWVVVLSIAVMVGAFFRVVAMTSASVNVSRRIHEYCINSLFVNSSTVLKIKKSLSSVQTFLYMDILSIDNFLSYYLHDVFVLSIETAVQMLTLFFMMPWSTPIAILLGFVILRFVVYCYVKSCKNVYFARLETFNQINATIESAISGLPLYRSFKKEWELVHSLVEHVDYNLRCNYLTFSATTWTSISFRTLLSPLALFILLFPLVKSRVSGTEVQVGYYAMAYSVFLSLNGTFATFLKLYCFLELMFISIARFEYFVPPSTKIKFDKKRNIHRTDFVVDRSASAGDDKIADEDIKDTLRRRRHNGYAKRRASRCTSLKMLFFRHKVNVLDVSKYAVPGTTRIKLDNVSVHIFNKKTGVNFSILKNVTCSADTSDIIGVIGRTGAGKSTLLSVLQNLARNREGSVFLDGCDLNDMPKSVTRQVIGVLPQLPFVFRGWTVRRFIDPRMLFDDADIEMALEHCGLIKFVENIPGGKGLDTIIIPDHYHKDMPRYLKRAYYGPTLKPHDSPSADNVNIDYGSVLSSSQLRTLSVARLVLYREFFKVLLVDEPPEDELGAAASKTADIPIYELIKTYFQHCATFIAAHNTNVLRLCTSVWVFHKGSLIRTCKAEDIVDSSSLSKIVEDCITTHA
ncbi:ABC transporter, ATP-binding protein domain containing protein [Theileria equi strain WA]|uniref:ABC transporter, ATP-binding protein domain containing protein n=1 Tax=Theileria equi strain WA TaxID=1537102 RepID=L1LDH8_THEEQ|nr:ABC transporter, ATP-binding protein domain containing protein [Theileria equi strain WA]EKX73290.1 ABC transporter, ATP-binding protein domain containing protein [Theileria equi strain WA]|eukprot:XP_004832742.1 ABC transporter, ATP-binding protein domain containing protein [Theileria equi strain WA]